MKPTSAYGSSLPRISSHRPERRDVQLLERAQLALAHDRHRRQVRRDDEQQQREHAGHHEVPALELRVEPDAHAAVDAGRPDAVLRRHAALNSPTSAAAYASATPDEFASVPSAST